MGYWNYKNVGASASHESKKYIEKIFEYIGYAPKPDCSNDYGKCSFRDPEVYGCEYSEIDSISGRIKDCFSNYQTEDLLYILNALFPNTKVYIHKSEGNNTSDTWEDHDEIYDTTNMTYYGLDSYTDYGGGGANGTKQWKSRFTLKLPRSEYIQSLIDLSQKDNNEELTELLVGLYRKIEEGLISYKDDPLDTRVIGKEYDVEDNVKYYNEEDYADDAPEFLAKTITFGHYPQKKSGNDKTPIEWIVLKKIKNSVLVISRFGLDENSYHSWSATTWENCKLRSWLNTEFLNTAFTPEEQTAILTTLVDNSQKQGQFDTDGGIETQDKVFLLSYSEAKEYFKTNEDRRCVPTAYAKAQGADYDNMFKSNGHACGSWLLRSPGGKQDYVMDVESDGSFSDYGVGNSGFSIRPSFWLKLDKAGF